MRYYKNQDQSCLLTKQHHPNAGFTLVVGGLQSARESVRGLEIMAGRLTVGRPGRLP